MPRKIQTSILLERDELESLKRMSEKSGKSRSRLIREALSTFLNADILEHDMSERRKRSVV